MNIDANRGLIYFAIALIPALYWIFWAAFGLLVFVHYASDNADFLKASIVHGVGTVGGISTLYYLLNLDRIEGKSIIISVNVFITMTLLLGYHLYIDHVPTDIGVPFAIVLMVILVASSHKLITKYVTNRSTTDAPKRRAD